MSLPGIDPQPVPDDSLPPARRRRMRRLVAPVGLDAPTDRLTELGKRVVPGAEFYLSALLAGLIAGLGFLLDAPALLVLAVLLAPFMGPALGLGMATIGGSVSFLARSLGSLLIGGIIFLLTGSLAGWAARVLPPPGYAQLASFLQFSWPAVLLLTVGTVVSLLLLARPHAPRPQLSSVALAYTIYLPLSAAGFGLTAGFDLAWETGLLAFLGGALWAALAGALTLVFLGLHPRQALSYALIAAYVLAFAAGGLVQVLAGRGLQLAQAANEPARPSLTSRTSTPVDATSAPGAGLFPAATQSATPLLASPTANPTPTHTLVPSRTPTITVTPQPTPVWARINAKGGNGAYIRSDPQYSAEIVVSLLNGHLVQVLDEVAASDGVTWVKVQTEDGREGWIVRSLLATATPAPGW